MKTSHILLSLLIAAAPLPAFAQTLDNSQNGQRIERLEHDLMLLQRQIARGEPSGPGVISGATDPAANPAQLEVRLSNIEDQIRELRGKVEEAQFQNKKLSDRLDKFQQDVDLRFEEAKPKTAGAAGTLGEIPSAEAPRPIVAAPAEQPADAPANTLQLPQAATTPVQPLQSLSAPAAPKAEAPAAAPSSFATPREHYNYAFRLLNETKYEESAAIFADFTKKYPKDPLVGNAYYWGGETYYIRHDFVNAADHFRQGFETLPDGPKAADNLLKLAMSLNALKRDKDACVVLGQITTKFKKKSATVTDKATAEHKRIGCKP